MAANVILPFLLSMMLGRTIDLTSYTIRGNNVFDDSEYEEISTKDLRTKYNVLQEDTIPYTFYGVPPDIALKIKSNFLSSFSGANGLDGLLKDNSWKYNSAIITFTTLYRTVGRKLKDDASPVEGWREKVPTDQTHYVRGLYYGGWAVVLFRFQCDIASDVPFVRKTLTKHFGVVGLLTNDTQAKYEEAMADVSKNANIRGRVKLTTYVYSTMPFRGTVATPADIMKITEKLARRAGPVGQPLIMDLRPLHDLDPKYPVVVDNTELIDELEKLDEMLDDVQVTKSSMMSWILETTTVFEEDQEKRVTTLLKRVNDCIRAFSKVSASASLFKGTDRAQLDSAFQKYKSGLERGVPTYNMAFRRLKEEIDAQCENTFLHKIKGLLRVYDHEKVSVGRTQEVEACMLLCVADPKCRSIGYATEMQELDMDTGLYHTKYHECWLYYRSTSTASVNTPSGISGDLGVYDRHCYQNNV